MKRCNFCDAFADQDGACYDCVENEKLIQCRDCKKFMRPFVVENLCKKCSGPIIFYYHLQQHGEEEIVLKIPITNAGGMPMNYFYDRLSEMLRVPKRAIAINGNFWTERWGNTMTCPAEYKKEKWHHVLEIMS